MSIRIRLWGTRGSLPAPQAPAILEERFKALMTDFLEQGNRNKSELDKFLKELPNGKIGGFGGNTSCIEVSSRGSRLIIDGGSGIRPLGDELMKGPCAEGKGEEHILFTHFHWDHVIGLPFFTPIFVPGNKIHVYAVQPDLKDVFSTVFRKPFFPVSFDQIGAEVVFHTLEPRRPKQFGSLKVTPYGLDHPDPCWGYLFDDGKRSFSYCVDTECTRFSRDEIGQDLPLYQGVDLMIFDAQYTLVETAQKINWGHAAGSLGLDLAIREGIPRVLFTHHDPGASDEKIARAEAEARLYYESQLRSARRSGSLINEVDWRFAIEGMTIEL